MECVLDRFRMPALAIRYRLQLFLDAILCEIVYRMNYFENHEVFFSPQARLPCIVVHCKTQIVFSYNYRSKTKYKMKNEQNDHLRMVVEGAQDYCGTQKMSTTFQ